MSKSRLEQDASKVEKADVTRLLAKWPKLESMVRSNKRLQPFWEDINTAYHLLRDYSTRRYREIPWGSIAAIVAALFYVLNPLDLVPDMIPFLGLVDDASVLALCWSMVRQDLDKYRAYLTRKNGQNTIVTPPDQADKSAQ